MRHPRVDAETQRGLGSDPGRGSSLPRPEHLHGLVSPWKNSHLLEQDPAMLLAQFLCEPSNSPGRSSMRDWVFDIASSIHLRIFQNGLPKNPDTEVVLKELFSPKLLREVITGILRERDSRATLSPIVTLCFIYHPVETLDEIRFLSRQMLRSPGQKVVWNEVADGLIEACKLVPARWTYLAPGQRRMPKGPDFLDARLKTLDLRDLLYLPAFVVEATISNRKPPKESESKQVLNFLCTCSRTFLELPSFLPVLRYMKRGNPSPVIADTVVSKVVSDIQKAITIQGEAGPIAQWMHSHRSGEPTRLQGSGESLVRAYIEELFEFSEFKDALSKYGSNSLEVYVNIRSQRAALLTTACDVTSRVLGRDSDFRREDIRAILAALETYENAGLERCIQLGHTLLAGGQTTSSHTSGCELAMTSAYRGPQKIAGLGSAMWLYNSNKSDLATQTVIRVVSHSASPSQLTSLLGTSIGSPSIEYALSVWDLLPSGHEALLFHFLYVRGSTLGIAPDELADGCKRWGNLSEADMSKLGSQLIETKGEDLALFLTALSKIRIATPDFIQWRTSLVHHILERENARMNLPLEKAGIIIPLLYEGVLTEELQESKVSVGLHTNLCSLKLSPQEEGELSEGSGRILAMLNRWMNGAFSDYALERGLFTSTSVFLEGYGQTKRTLKDLCRLVKRDLRAHPKSVPTQKLYKAITAFQKARRTGENLERLRRRLACNDLLQYREAEIPVVAATETYLRRHGIQEERRPLTQFPALMLLRKVGAASLLVPHSDENRRPALRVVRRSREELSALVSQCREKVDAELTFKGRLSFPRLLTLESEQRHITRIFGRLLLGAAVAFGGAMVNRGLREPESSSTGAGQQSVVDDLNPSGSLPRFEKVIGKLSCPFNNRRNDFFLSHYVGATSATARQPKLMYEGSDVTRDWIRSFDPSELDDCVHDPSELDDCVHAEIYLVRYSQIPLPIGTRTRSGMAVRQANGFVSLTISTSKEKVLDSSLRGEDLVRELGDRHLELSRPRLRFSELQAIDPRLAESIERARTMNALDAVEYLRGTVAGLIRYEESPEYDNFRGTFAEYLRTILKNGTGICGQFSLVFDEALKQAGIPSCIALGYLPKDDRVTYTTAGAHATNVVFLRSTDGTVVPRIFDATGMGTLPAIQPDSTSLFDLVVPGALTVGGLGGAAILLHLRQRRRAEQLENAALEKVPHTAETQEESLTKGDQSVDVETKSSSKGVDPEVIVTKWVLHHLHYSPETTLRDIKDHGLEDFEAFDIDSAIRGADAMKRELMMSTPTTSWILAKTGWSEDETTVGIVNGWLRCMEDPGQRRQWVAYLQDRKLFTSRDAEALLRWAHNVVPAFKEENSRYRFRPRLNLFSRTALPTSECLLRALTPIDT